MEQLLCFTRIIYQHGLNCSNEFFRPVFGGGRLVSVPAAGSVCKQSFLSSFLPLQSFSLFTYFAWEAILELLVVFHSFHTLPSDFEYIGMSWRFFPRRQRQQRESNIQGMKVS